MPKSGPRCRSVSSSAFAIDRDGVEVQARIWPVEVADDEDRIGTVQSASVICGNVGRIDLDFLDIVEFGYDRGEVRSVPSDYNLGAGGERATLSFPATAAQAARGVDSEVSATPPHR